MSKVNIFFVDILVTSTFLSFDHPNSFCLFGSSQSNVLLLLPRSILGAQSYSFQLQESEDSFN